MSIQAYYEERKARDLQVTEDESMTFPPHLHADLELFLVRSGRFRVTVGNHSQELSAGAFAVIFPNTIHSYQCLIPGSQFTMVVCGASLLGSSLSRLTHFRPIYPFLQGESLHPDIPYAMHGLFLQSRTEPNHEIYRALIRLIIARCLSSMELEPVKEPASMDLTGSLLRYLSQNFQRPLSLDLVSRELGVSKYHLSHVFSSRLHTSFPEYVNFLRLDLARELLLTTDQSILEVGLSCGFSSQRTFNRAFQAHFAMSPRQYRFQQKL